MTPPRPLATADPLAAYRSGAGEIDAAVRRVLESGRYILGPEVAAFEREFAGYLGCAQAVGVASGTDALELALRAVGVTAGDRVLTVAHTATATVAAIELAGARPVFVDIEPSTMVMDPAGLDRLLAGPPDPALRAVVPVHLYGLPADMPRILAIARRHRLAVVEDCAQAHGAAVGGRRVGTWGDAAAFSFYPTKNLGAIGDGGAVATDDARVAEQVRLRRQFGWRDRYVSEVSGKNSRLDELQAAILRAKLPHLDAGNARRRALAARYLTELRGTRLVLPQPTPGSEPVWHQFVVRTPGREALRNHLASDGIQTSVLYPVPVHGQPAYRNADVSLPETERACRELLGLPIHPELADADVRRVCERVKEWDAAQR